ncbi:unnamed protein product [Rotaria sp. Silwood2]|nr:unnamed protein product [Rotaria sp. Silwood2]
MVRLHCAPVNVTLLAIYSPVNPNGQQMAINASDRFYADLQRAVNKTPPSDLLLIMGDFNARVGKQQHQTSGNVVGPHAVDHINENGKRLVDFCAANKLIISNTFFQHKGVHQMTWMHPGNKKWHMLDYTLVNRKFRSSVEDVRRPRNSCVRKRWEDKILDDLDQCQIRNWRKVTLDRDKWRETINKNAQVKPPSTSITETVQHFKQRAQDRRTLARNGSPRKVTEILTRTVNNNYNCPRCKKSYRPQGITNHVRSCAMEWCKQNGIQPR